MKEVAPLECNPEVFNAFLAQMGVHAVNFVDVYGLDPSLLEYVPRPVHAILLVFPISEKYEAYRKSQPPQEKKSTAAWSEQTIKNSCGTMALWHALANGVPHSQLGSGFGSEFISQFKAKSANERPDLIENSIELKTLHDAMANAGESAQPGDFEDVECHYVCLTKNGNELVELDGRRDGPIVRANNMNVEDLLSFEPTLDVVKEFMEREQDSHQFAMMALVDA